MYFKNHVIIVTLALDLNVRVLITNTKDQYENLTNSSMTLQYFLSSMNLLSVMAIILYVGSR